MHAARTYYPKLMILVHWLTLLLVIGVYAAIELRGIFPKEDPLHAAMKSWHFTLGLSVLFITIMRLGMRAAWARVIPPIEPAAPALQETLAKLVHLMLYVLLLGLPIAGWLILSAAGKPIPFFSFDLPALIDVNKELSKQIKEVHETIANIGYGLIGLHALAAIYHHYIVKDNTLVRMLPLLKR